MSDDLTERIAAVLEEHLLPWVADDETDEFRCLAVHCDFVWTGPKGADEAQAAHQAEQVRAVLGETTTEWEHRNTAGGGAIFRTREEAEQEMARWDAYTPYPVDEPPLPPTLGIFRREVGPWTEARP